jgi:hypothetical protein
MMRERERGGKAGTVEQSLRKRKKAGVGMVDLRKVASEKEWELGRGKREGLEPGA